jgi:hypothetical protein
LVVTLAAEAFSGVPADGVHGVFGLRLRLQLRAKAGLPVDLSVSIRSASASFQTISSE